MMRLHAIIVAAGAGQRAGPGAAKQWRLLGAKAVARWSLETFLSAGAHTVVVVPPDGLDLARVAFAGLAGFSLVEGGSTRTASVRAGLAELTAEEGDAVLIHDAARPFVRREHIDALLQALGNAEGALPALPVSDTLKQVRPNGRLVTAPREGLWQAQTPQAFRYGAIRDAYSSAPDAAPTDDAALVEASNGRVVLTPGDPMLMKLTYAQDFAMAENLLSSQRTTRVGSGFDVHAFGEGDAVWLCGVKIPHAHGLVGHSDADVGLHALTDAILGAISEGDIGDHFPPTDQRWRGADSSVFLSRAGALVASKGGVIEHVDITLICEAPKIKPHRDEMCARIANILALPTSCVSVKATTTERLGFTGRGEGMAAQAVATVSLPRL